MRPALCRMLWVAALIASPALAVDQTIKDWPAGDRQKARMPECTAKASGLTGKERKVFMNECLKGTPAPKAQQGGKP